MRKNNLSLSILSLGALYLLSSCSNQVETPEVVSKGDEIRTKSIDISKYSFTPGKLILSNKSSNISAQSIYIDPSIQIGPVVRNSIINKSNLRSALDAISVHKSINDALDWSSGTQAVENRSDIYDDIYSVEVRIPLKDNPKIIFKGNFEYYGGGNTDGYYESGGFEEAIKVSEIVNSIGQYSHWDLTKNTISTWVVKDTKGITTQSGNYDASSLITIAEDLEVPVSVRSPIYTMSVDSSRISAQAIIVNPITPTCQNGNGGVGQQAIEVNPAPGVCGTTPVCPPGEIISTSMGGIRQLSNGTYCQVKDPNAIKPTNCKPPAEVTEAYTDSVESMRDAAFDHGSAQNKAAFAIFGTTAGGGAFFTTIATGMCKVPGAAASIPGAAICLGTGIVTTVSAFEAYDAMRDSEEMGRRSRREQDKYYKAEAEYKGWFSSRGCAIPPM